MTGNQLIRSSSGAVTGFRHDIIVVTTEHVPGYHIKETLGIVRGNTIRARNIGRDLSALWRNIVGGEVREYTKLMAESREQAMDRMLDQAVQIGANAVVGLRLSTSMLMASAAEILAYGTAVTLERVDAPQDKAPAPMDPPPQS